jgi:hypothetical protein
MHTTVFGERTYVLSYIMTRSIMTKRPKILQLELPPTAAATPDNQKSTCLVCLLYCSCLQVCRTPLTVEKESAIVGMSQKARLARCNFFASTLELAVNGQTVMRVHVKNSGSMTQNDCDISQTALAAKSTCLRTHTEANHARYRVQIIGKCTVVIV